MAVTGGAKEVADGSQEEKQVGRRLEEEKIDWGR